MHKPFKNKAVSSQRPRQASPFGSSTTIAQEQAVAEPSTRPTAAQLLATAGGTPLPGPVLQRMERAFGTGFGRVRVHRGDEAEAFDAQAFTAGERIFLPRRAPSLTSQEGQALIGHELAHVLQQRSGRVRASGPGVTVDPHPGLEAEAEAAGQAIARGVAPPSSASTQTAGDPPSGPVVQRKRGKQSRKNRKARLADTPEAEAKRRERAERHAGHGRDDEDMDLGGFLEMAETSPAPEPASHEASPASAPEPEKPKPAPPSKRQQRRRNAALKRQLRSADALFGEGRGSGNPSLQANDQQMMQGLAGSADLAKQAEALSAMLPPAPAPSEDWAQPQPLGDPSAPPLLPMPDPPQPESPVSIQPDPPPSPLNAVAPSRSWKEFEHDVKGALGVRPPPVQAKRRNKRKA